MNDVIRSIFGGEQADVRNLVKVAFAEGNIDESDVDYLNKELQNLKISEKQVKTSKTSISSLKKKLPHDPFRIYKLIYKITKKMMSTNMLTDRKESLLRRLMSVFVKNVQSTTELILFLKYNIRYGNSIEDSYSRLGYLLQST